MVAPSGNTIDADTKSNGDGRTFEFSRTHTPSVAVVEAVSDVTDTDPTSGPPLHEYVDTDALNTLLMESNSDPETVQVTFEYHGHEITVVGDGTVTVRPIDGNDR